MKWLIPNNNEINDNETIAHWSEIHKSGYNIWSISEDDKLLNKLLTVISTILHKRILVIGCGSKIRLQNFLCNALETIERIVCTDFANVISLARKGENHPNIEYREMDSRFLNYENHFDVVININAILSQSDEQNRQILLSCQKALKKGGVFLGLFPTIICNIEIYCLEKRYNRLKRGFAKQAVNLDQNNDLLSIMVQNNQLFYTPLYLRCIIKESLLKLHTLELFFCESDDFYTQAKKLLLINDRDVLIYEFFVIATK